MTKLLVDKLLDKADLAGLAETCWEHAEALDIVAKKAGLLAGPCQEAEAALREAKAKLELLAGLLEQHARDAKVVSP